MDEMTTSTLLFVIATALISLAFSSNMLGTAEHELSQLHDAVAQAHQQARVAAHSQTVWASADLSRFD